MRTKSKVKTLLLRALDVVVVVLDTLVEVHGGRPGGTVDLQVLGAAFIRRDGARRYEGGVGMGEESSAQDNGKCVVHGKPGK